MTFSAAPTESVDLPQRSVCQWHRAGLRGEAKVAAFRSKVAEFAQAPWSRR